MKEKNVATTKIYHVGHYQFETSTDAKIFFLTEQGNELARSWLEGVLNCLDESEPFVCLSSSCEICDCETCSYDRLKNKIYPWRLEMAMEFYRKQKEERFLVADCETEETIVPFTIREVSQLLNPSARPLEVELRVPSIRHLGNVNLSEPQRAIDNVTQHVEGRFLKGLEIFSPLSSWSSPTSRSPDDVFAAQNRREQQGTNPPAAELFSSSLQKKESSKKLPQTWEIKRTIDTSKSLPDAAEILRCAIQNRSMQPPVRTFDNLRITDVFRSRKYYINSDCLNIHNDPCKSSVGVSELVGLAKYPEEYNSIIELRKVHGVDLFDGIQTPYHPGIFMCHTTGPGGRRIQRLDKSADVIYQNSQIQGAIDFIKTDSTFNFSNYIPVQEFFRSDVENLKSLFPPGGRTWFPGESSRTPNIDFLSSPIGAPGISSVIPVRAAVETDPTSNLLNHFPGEDLSGDMYASPSTTRMTSQLISSTGDVDPESLLPDDQGSQTPNSSNITGPLVSDDGLEFRLGRPTKQLIMINIPIHTTLITVKHTLALSQNSEILFVLAEVLEGVVFLIIFIRIFSNLFGRNIGVYGARNMTRVGFVATAYALLLMGGMVLTEDLKLWVTGALFLASALAFIMMLKE